MASRCLSVIVTPHRRVFGVSLGGEQAHHAIAVAAVEARHRHEHASEARELAQQPLVPARTRKIAIWQRQRTNANSAMRLSVSRVNHTVFGSAAVATSMVPFLLFS